jgi:protoporphyrinogen oxidase
VPGAVGRPGGEEVVTTDGRRWTYDVLLSTMPSTTSCRGWSTCRHAWRTRSAGLNWSGSHIVGVGLDRPANSTKNWIYFPEPSAPFYRVTYLSNYSQYITPDPDQTLFLTETSRSSTSPSRRGHGRAGHRRSRRDGLMEESERSLVASTWLCSPEMSYPVPSVTRDAALGTIQPWLRSKDIWSRGRFGAWLYEIGNMDHSAMQGVEFANHALLGEAETVWIPRGES